LHNIHRGRTHPLGYMAGSVLVFRGALLPPFTITQFATHQGLRRWTDLEILSKKTKYFDFAAW